MACGLASPFVTPSAAEHLESQTAIRSSYIMVFPKTGDQARVQENRAALHLKLAHADFKDPGQAFRPPRRIVKLQSRWSSPTRSTECRGAPRRRGTNHPQLCPVPPFG